MNSNISSLQNDYSLNEFEELIEKDDVTIVIPVLNEELAIESVLKDVILNDYRNILVIDGNSVDDTVKVVQKMNILVYPQVGKGKTGAIKTALNYINTPYFVVIDGDNTYSAKDIETLLDKASFHNQVIGVRRDRKKIPRFNRFGNNMINLFFNYSFSAGLTDVCSGLYMLNTEFAKKLQLETSGFALEVEIASQSVETNKVAECPISYGDRIGQQKLKPIRDGFLIICSIVNLTQKCNPLFFYSYLVGFVLIAAGFGLFIYNSLFSTINSSLSLDILYTLIISIGFQFLILSLAISQIKKIQKQQTYDLQMRAGQK